MAMEQEWMQAVTENPKVGDTEVWEFYNFTADAHPMHVHEVVFEVVNREGLVVDPTTEEPVQPVQLTGNRRGPELWERGFKDTVIAYPGEVTRIRATVQGLGPVRLALPHRRARGQRDDAAIPHRTAAEGPAARGSDAAHVILKTDVAHTRPRRSAIAGAFALPDRSHSRPGRGRLNSCLARPGPGRVYQHSAGLRVECGR